MNGFSPTVTVYEDTDTAYKLTITDVNGSYQTPNLKGLGGGSGSVSWGDILGTISDQTDLMQLFNGKAPLSHTHTVSNISDFPTSLPASDVSAWAKSATKPTYTANEVGALPSTTTIPSKTSDLSNDSNYVSDKNYVHTDNNFTNALKTSYDNAVTNNHTHSNKTVLDNTTANYTTEEKTKLSGIANNANNYNLPIASADTLGGVKIGNGLSIADGVISALGGGGSQTITPLFDGTSTANTPVTMAYPLKDYLFIAIYAKTTLVPVIQLVPIKILNSSGITEVYLLGHNSSNDTSRKWTFDFTNNTVKCDLAANTLKVWGIN